MDKKYEKLSKEELMEVIDKLEQRKKYGLIWDAEKVPEKVVQDCSKHLPVLKEIKENEIIDKDSNLNHILIEGDNFHTLSALSYTHKESIDVIYIDPPYNTRNKDFIYNDHYVDKDDGFKHSKWLNFMEKRLKLAKDLLKDNGKLIISIDDNELYQLKILCDEIFGEDNFVVNLPTIMNLKGNQDQYGFAGTHEYTLIYVKNKSLSFFNEFKIDDEELLEWEEDDFGFFKKGANLKATGVNAPRSKRPNLFFPIFLNKNNDIYVTDDNTPYKKDDKVLLPITDGNEMSWRWSKNKIKSEPHNIIVSENGEGFSIYKKQRPNLGDLPSKKPKSIFYRAEYSSGNGTGLLKEIFGKKLFNNPKPLQLIKDLIYITSDKNSLVLDFMAGSGTTGHAVLDLNKEDGGNRKFILCTNNENNICSKICYPRLKNIMIKSNFGKYGDNLKYFKTDFVKNSLNKDQLKIDITKNCSGMLCLKEDIFNLYKETKDYKIFSENNRSIAIYFNFISESLFDLIEDLKKIKGTKKLYCFTLDPRGLDESLFDEVEDLEIEAIPHKMLEVYKQIFN